MVRSYKAIEFPASFLSSFFELTRKGTRKGRLRMSRLTQTDDSGNWSLKGLPWKDTYVGQVITRNTSEKIRIALWKLKDYEESGLDPEQVQQLKELYTAEKPIKTTDETGIRYTDSYRCPNCGGNFTGTGIADFCYHCGQRLDWS